MLDACHGAFPGEAFVISPPAMPYLSQVNAPLRKMRISLSLEPWGPFHPQPEIADQVRSIASLCEDMGHEVVEATPPIDFSRFYETFRDEYIVKLPSSLDAAARRMKRAVTPETVEPILMKAYGCVTRMSAADHLECLSMMNVVTRQVGTFFEEFDLLLTPTLAVPPPVLGTQSTHQIDMSLDEFFARFFGANPYTPLCNFIGIPAISLPLGQTADGLPVGVQFAAPFGLEDRLIRMASALENARPWSDRLPAVHVARAAAA